MSPPPASPRPHPFTRHARRWRQFTYVYPVISRRSGGLSIGVNLNVDKRCNFDCPYCQVDRTSGTEAHEVDLDRLAGELAWMVEQAAGGTLWDDPAFADVPPALRRFNDIAFSGDGEPTLYKHFDQACRIAADIKARSAPDQVVLAVLTNATLLHQPRVQRGLAVLAENNGQVWAKLDAGTPSYYRLIDRSPVPLSRVLANIADAGRRYALIIQSMFVRLNGRAMPPDQFQAYLDRLAELLAGGCRIRLVQMYTLARPPAQALVSPLENRDLDRLAGQLRRHLPDLPCRVFYAAP